MLFQTSEGSSVAQRGNLSQSGWNRIKARERVAHEEAAELWGAAQSQRNNLFRRWISSSGLHALVNGMTSAGR